MRALVLTFFLLSFSALSKSQVHRGAQPSEYFEPTPYRTILKIDPAKKAAEISLKGLNVLGIEPGSPSPDETLSDFFENNPTPPEHSNGNDMLLTSGIRFKEAHLSAANPYILFESKFDKSKIIRVNLKFTPSPDGGFGTWAIVP